MAENSEVMPGLALCLTSSFLGHYAHMGLLNRLDAGGVIPERIAGSSGGAIAGGLFCGGIRGRALEELALNFWFKLAFGDAGFLLRWPFVMTGIHGSGFLSGGRMRKVLRKRLGDRRIEELREPMLELAVSNLTRQQPEMIREGPLADFMVASFSIPCMFQAQEIGGSHYVDGGVVFDAPFGHLLEEPSVDTVVVHSIVHPSKKECAPRTFGAVLVKAHRVVVNHMLADLKARAERSDKRVIFLETEHSRPGVLEIKGARKYIEAGAASGERLLEQLGVRA